MDESEWRPIAEYCLEDGEDFLWDNEIEFLNDILDDWQGDLTDAQAEWLSAIQAKVDYHDAG